MKSICEDAIVSVVDVILSSSFPAKFGYVRSRWSRSRNKEKFKLDEQNMIMQWQYSRRTFCSGREDVKTLACVSQGLLICWRLRWQCNGCTKVCMHDALHLNFRVFTLAYAGRSTTPCGGNPSPYASCVHLVSRQEIPLLRRMQHSAPSPTPAVSICCYSCPLR